MVAINDRLTTVFYSFSKHEIPQLKLQHSSLKIALLTDLHSCFYGEQQHEIMDILRLHQPDIILLGGDIYDDVLAPDNTDQLLSQFKTLNTRHIFYVNGNHELWLSPVEYTKIERRIRQYGIHILHGQGVAIPNTNIYIWGVADPESGQFSQQLTSVGKQAKPKNVNILLTHRPEYIKNYLNYSFDLIVAGHAHGGQWRIPKIVNGLFAPNQGFFPRYAGGQYLFQRTSTHTSHFIVSRGLARESTRYIPRVFNRPELVFIELKHP